MNRELAGRLLDFVKSHEWETHHAAENRYCPYCMKDDESWEDQQSHHEGCAWVKLVSDLEEYLKGVQ